MVKTVIFDNDGVLVDTEELFYQANRLALAEIGIDLTLETFREVSLKRGQSCFEGVKSILDEKAVEELRRRRDVFYEQLLSTETVEREGIREVLEALRPRCRLGIVTSAGRRHFELMHARTRLLPFFSFVLTLEDYRFVKPDPDPYLTALRRYNLPPNECLAVEDSERGVRSATSAGLRCVAAPTPLTQGSDFSSAFQVIQDLRQLIEIVNI